MDVGLCRGYLQLGVLHVLRRTTSKVRLVLLALRMREIGSLIGVQCQAELALERTEMVTEDIRVLIRESV